MSSNSILISKPHQKFKIFIVDDDPFSLNYYAEQFNRIGCFDVSTFLTGEECLDRLVEKPDVVFLDFHLATLSGIKTLWKIKSYDHNIYVIILSGEEQSALVDLSLNLGAFDFFIKGKTDTNKFESVLTQIQQISNVLSRKEV